MVSSLVNLNLDMNDEPIGFTRITHSLYSSIGSDNCENFEKLCDMVSEIGSRYKSLFWLDCSK